MLIYTDYIHRCKSYYHTIVAMIFLLPSKIIFRFFSIHCSSSSDLEDHVYKMAMSNDSEHIAVQLPNGSLLKYDPGTYINNK